MFPGSLGLWLVRSDLGLRPAYLLLDRGTLHRFVTRRRWSLHTLPRLWRCMLP